MTRPQVERTFNTLTHERAQKRLGEILDHLYGIRIALLDVRQHDLFYARIKYIEAIAQAEEDLLNLIDAVEHVSAVENRLNEWL